MLAGGLAGTGAPAPVGRSGRAGRVPKILHHTYKTKNPADWPLKSYASAALHPTAAAARPCVPVGLTATFGRRQVGGLEPELCGVKPGLGVLVLGGRRQPRAVREASTGVSRPLRPHQDTGPAPAPPRPAQPAYESLTKPELPCSCCCCCRCQRCAAVSSAMRRLQPPAAWASAEQALSKR